MTDELRTCIAAVAKTHLRYEDMEGGVYCSCESAERQYSYRTGYRDCGDDDGYAEHLADAVIRELHLTEVALPVFARYA